MDNSGKQSTGAESASLDRETIDAIVGGRLGDSSEVLGLHANPSGKGLVIRAWIPGAQNVDVIAPGGRKIASLDCIHEAGLFAKQFRNRKNRFEYRLRIDEARVEDDPYRFAGGVQDDDLYLFAEGSSEHAYRWMGAHGANREGVDGVQFVV